MNYISPMANNVAWHGAVEKLLGIEITPRCKYIRTIICELARISDHLLCNGAVGLDTGAFTFFLYALLSARSHLRHLRDALRRAVHEQLHARRRLDARHHAAGDREDSRRSCKTFPKTLDDMERLLNRNRIFVDRTKGVGILTQGRGDQPQRHRARSPAPAA